ncbi:unnamed protein product [Chrysoparadoxa australica]
MEGGLIDAAVEERQQQQRDEIELLEAVYAAEFSLIPNGSEIQFKFALCSQREHFLWARLPALYPVQPPVWEVRSRTLSRAGRRAVEEAARKVLEQSPEGVACCLQLLQATEEALADFKEEEAASTSQRGPHQTPAPQAPTQAVLGRRLLFSHHIIARSKRDGIRSEAKDLNIGGYAKIGWPGVIVIEGEESDCTEYVRRLMRWRWKQLVVRGEEQHVLPAGEDLNEHRRLPQKMTELGEKEMSLLGQLCKEAGVREALACPHLTPLLLTASFLFLYLEQLHELFMTHIK